MPATPLQDIIEQARTTGRLTFSGELEIATTDSHAVALHTLSELAKTTGVMVVNVGNYAIKCYPAYDHGYFELDWQNGAKGVTRVSYWRAETRDLETRDLKTPEAFAVV